MEFKGTKGYWEVQNNNPEHFFEIRNEFGGDHISVNVFCYDRKLKEKHLSEENKANAYGISAVPEMIEALKIAIKAYKELGIDQEQNCYKQAVKALNKALNLKLFKDEA